MNYTILLDKLYHTYILKSSNHYLNTDLQPEFFQVNRIVHICEPISISSARRSTVKLSLQAMRIKQFLLHFKTYGYQVSCIIGHYLEDNQPFSKICKGTITTMYQVLFLGAIRSVACYIHIANTYIVNHHLLACKKYLQEPPRCEYFLLRIGLCCMDAMAFQVGIKLIREK